MLELTTISTSELFNVNPDILKYMEVIYVIFV